MASLIYLATQIKASAISSKVEAKLTTTGFMTQFNDYFIREPELFELWTGAHKGTQNFSAHKLARFTNLKFNAICFFLLLTIKNAWVRLKQENGLNVRQ